MASTTDTSMPFVGFLSRRERGNGAVDDCPILVHCDRTTCIQGAFVHEEHSRLFTQPETTLARLAPLIWLKGNTQASVFAWNARCSVEKGQAGEQSLSGKLECLMPRIYSIAVYEQYTNKHLVSTILASNGAQPNVRSFLGGLKAQGSQERDDDE